MKLFPLVLLLGLTGCLPAYLPLEGLLCDEQHQCGQDRDGTELVCSAGKCGRGDRSPGDGGFQSSDSGTPPVTNLLRNGDIELGVTDWHVSSGKLDVVTAPVHGGGHALALSHTSTGALITSYATVLAPVVAAGQAYCVETYVQRGDVLEELRLIARGYSDGGSYVDAPPIAGSTSTESGPGWIHLEAQYGVVEPYTAGFNFRVSVQETSGTQLFIDDARAWVAPSGQCF